MRRFFLLLPILLVACSESPNAAAPVGQPQPSISSIAAAPSSEVEQPVPNQDTDHSDATSPDLPDTVQLHVPFTSQAPHANWDPPFDEACEEASYLMVEYMFRGEDLPPDRASEAITSLASWEAENGYAIDITIDQLAEIAERRFDREATAFHGDEVTVEKIQGLLAAGHPVIIPAAGRELGNPYFSGDGPPYHMLVITGYKTGVFGGVTFVTNDPGTKRGQNYEYPASVIDAAIHDWNGSVDTILSGPRAMLIIEE